MATFELTSPQGQKYRVTGPEGATEQDALRQLQRQLAGLPIEQAPSVGDQAADIAQSARSGLVKGTIGLAGQPADTLTQSKQIGGFLGDKLGLSPEMQSKIGQGFDLAALSGLLGPFGALGSHTPGGAAIRSAVEDRVGKLYEPKTQTGRYTETATSFLPSAFAGPGGIPRKIVGALVSGLASEAAGQATEGTEYEPAARAAAAVAAPVIGGRLITPVRSYPGRQNAADVLRQEGVTDLTAGQVTGNKRLRYAESELGGSTAESMMERQGEQFTRAALRRVGEAADRATPEVIDRAFTRIGGHMDRLAAANNLIADARMVHDLNRTVTNYNNLVAPPMRAPILQNVLDRMTNSMNAQGLIPGRTYQALRSDIGRYARGSRNDPNLQRALYEIQAALDANVERVIGQNNPNQLGLWREARRQYRNMIVIERAANYAGEEAASGIITPSNLARSTKALHEMRNYSRGRGDFTPLARAGVEVMSKLPNSGTAQRLRAHSIPAAIAAAIGGTAGSAAGPLGTAGGIAAGVIAPRLAGEAVLSRPGRAYLSNQALQRDPNALATAAVRGVTSQYGGPQ